MLHTLLDSYKNKYIQPIQYCTIVENIHNRNNLFFLKKICNDHDYIMSLTTATVSITSVFIRITKALNSFKHIGYIS